MLTSINKLNVLKNCGFLSVLLGELHFKHGPNQGRLDASLIYLL